MQIPLTPFIEGESIRFALKLFLSYNYGIEMVTKLFLLQFAIFRRYFVKLAQNDFHRSDATV